VSGEPGEGPPVAGEGARAAVEGGMAMDPPVALVPVGGASVDEDTEGYSLDSSVSDSQEYVVERVVGHKVVDGISYFDTKYQDEDLWWWVKASSFVDENGLVNEVFKEYVDSLGRTVASFL
jgi:hypothetical protein